MKKPKVVFYKDSGDKWRWSLVAANGRKLCTPGEGFSSKRKAEDNYELIHEILLLGGLGIRRVYK